MNITSMSNRELYKILTGYDYPNGKNVKPAELTETLDGERIDFNDINVWRTVTSRSIIELGRGIEGAVPTKERIAEYYGNMAKRLDEAYAEGKFTKEEYDYLNEGIAEHMEHSADCAEETAARRAVGYNRSMSLQSFEKRMSMTREERKADLKAEIDEYIEKYFKIDRTSLMQFIQ